MGRVALLDEACASEELLELAGRDAGDDGGWELGNVVLDDGELWVLRDEGVAAGFLIFRGKVLLLR